MAVKKKTLHRYKKGGAVLEKNVEISLLYDFYGQLLSAQQQKAVSLYYNDDLSLSEIALELNITRQGVRDSVKRAETQLYLYESKLGLMERFGKVERGLHEIERLAAELKEEYNKQKAERIVALAASLHE
jgi:predicted DNA-binding protein YlxM (UPF0122 family)